MLVIIGGSVFWFGYSLLSFFIFFLFLFLIFLIFNIFFTLKTLFYCFFSPLSFFLPFLLSRVVERVLVLRPVPLRWESRVQDIGPPKTSWLHVISNGESCRRDLHLNTKTQLHSTTSKLHWWTPYAKQLARQKHNPTH